jgi:hypothetical protein
MEHGAPNLRHVISWVKMLLYTGVEHRGRKLEYRSWTSSCPAQLGWGGGGGACFMLEAWKNVLYWLLSQGRLQISASHRGGSIFILYEYIVQCECRGGKGREKADRKA